MHKNVNNYFTFFPAVVISQDYLKIDSLRKCLSSIQPKTHFSDKDTSLIRLYIKIGEEYNDVYPDTAIIFYNKAQEIAWKLNSKEYLAKAYGYLGLAYMKKCDYEMALNYT
ncbi:MAG: hypothetical protein Kow0068_16880 [Marinilabiliales bacterium]